MGEVGIALGSNLGDRLSNLHAAIHALREISADRRILEAPIYRTAPRLCPPDSPDFLNTVVEITYAGTPRGLLKLTQGIERTLGRTPPVERNAPRIIDLDLLYFGGECMAADDLTLPHPRIAERRFVLEPLAAIRPGLVLPGQTLPISELLKALDAYENQSAATG